jgi:tight adherence protein C
MSNTVILALIGVFASVALLSGSLTAMILSRTVTERRRLRAVTRESNRPAVLQEVMPLASEAPSGGWNDIAKLLPRSQKDMNRLRQRMVRAGIRYPSAPIVYSFVELVGPFVAAGLVLLLLPRPTAWYVAGAAALLLFFTPGLIVERLAAKRRQEIQNGLPDALDLLVVCIEAGSGIDQAIVKTSEELMITYPVLGEELRTLTMEIRAGKPRLEAFKNLAQRTKVEDVRSLVAMLIQTDRFGTSIGQALRTHSDTSRTKRRQRAEEAAQKIGVKLVFPLVLFFFPAFYVVVLGPAVIQFIRNFLGN